MLSRPVFLGDFYFIRVANREVRFSGALQQTESDRFMRITYIHRERPRIGNIVVNKRFTPTCAKTRAAQL